MARHVVALVAEVLLTVLVALLVGTVWQWIALGALAPGAAESARLLFFFMDIGLAVWVVLLIVLTVRRRALPGVAVTLVAAVAGVVLNFLTVLVVGLLQGGGETSVFLGYALSAGVGFLLAVLVVAPVVSRVVKPSAAGHPAA